MTTTKPNYQRQKDELVKQTPFIPLDFDAPDYRPGVSQRKFERSAVASKGSLGMYKGKLATAPTWSWNQNGDYYYDTALARIRVFNASDQTRNP